VYLVWKVREEIENILGLLREPLGTGAHIACIATVTLQAKILRHRQPTFRASRFLAARAMRHDSDRRQDNTLTCYIRVEAPRAILLCATRTTVQQTESRPTDVQQSFHNR